MNTDIMDDSFQTSGPVHLCLLFSIGHKSAGLAYNPVPVYYMFSIKIITSWILFKCYN